MKALAILAAAVLLLTACAPRTDQSPTPRSSGEGESPPEHPGQTQTPAPGQVPTATAADSAARIVGELSTREKAQTILMGYVPGTDPHVLSRVLADGPRNLILMGDNVPADPAELRRLTDAIAAAVDGPPPLIAIDEEGGDVARIPWDRGRSARDLKKASDEEVRRAFAERGELLREAGISLNFGVVADVPRGSGSFIYSRSYGMDPEVVAAAVAAATRGEDGRVATTLKHFPGHGAAEGDSHSSIPTTDLAYDAWRAGDARPFVSGIEAGAEAVMMGHLRFTDVDDLPASVSPAWYRVLRDELGFDGVAVTDDLGMLLASGDPAYADPVENAVAAVTAGADLALMIAGSSPEVDAAIIDGIAAAAERGDLPAERLDAAATRVTSLQIGMGLVGGPRQ